MKRKLGGIVKFPRNPHDPHNARSQIKQLCDSLSLYFISVVLTELWALICRVFEPWICSQESPIPGYVLNII